ncbi:phosphoribosylformimino-5-aminoimidazole carboxamide ribonucleotide (ProFAR) isomerase [Bradyrhizobium sp. i1.3.6]
MSTISGMPGPMALARGKHRRRRGLVQLDGAIAERERLLAFARDVLRRADSQQARIGGDVRALACSEQAMQRRALDLRSQVPQRDVEP